MANNKVQQKSLNVAEVGQVKINISTITPTNSLPVASKSAIKSASKKPVKLKAGQLTSLWKGIFNLPATGGYIGGKSTGEAMAAALMKELRQSTEEDACMLMGDMMHRFMARIEAAGGESMKDVAFDQCSDEFQALSGQFAGFAQTLGQWLQHTAIQDCGDLDGIRDDELLAEASAGLNFEEVAA